MDQISEPPSHSLDADVIVVGAGPVGLCLALQLGRSGRKILVLEKRLGEASSSMAIGVMPPSLRLFETLGLAAPLIQAGCAVQTAIVHDQTSVLGAVDFTRLPGPYPFILSIPQSELMRVLRQSLDDACVRVLEGCEAIGVSEHSSSVTVHVRDVRDGTRKAWTSAYVAACDGHDSGMRCALEIPIAWKQYPVSFAMGDFPDTTAWSHEAHLFFTPRGSVESFPLPQGRRRWVALVDDPHPNSDALVRQIRVITGLHLEVASERWHSAFTPERRLARTFYQGRAVLCGDAAHVMSPIGGQGMNTGFADAWHLATILKRLLQTEESHIPLFERYERDRRRAFHIAADRAARGMWLGTRTGRIPSALRAFILRQVLSSLPLSRRLAISFAMLTIPNGQDPIPYPSPEDAKP